MHLRGKAMSMEAILPNGQTQMLSMVSDYNFNWHTNYIYADDAAPLLPKGTILRITSWHDNTKNNPNNPDPNQWVGWGDRTVDEMAHAWVNVTYMDDEDFKAEVEKRKARLATTTNEGRRAKGHGRRESGGGSREEDAGGSTDVVAGSRGARAGRRRAGRLADGTGPAAAAGDPRDR